MAAFEELDWRRFDVWAIAGMGGWATIEESRHTACHAWLLNNGYQLSTLDCTNSISQTAANLYKLLRWEEQFGYTPDSARRNLDALRDGFDFGIPDGGGHVLELVGVEQAWKEESAWVGGLLSIAQEYSRCQLALGRRFFVLMVVTPSSPLIGAVIEETRVPPPFWDPSSGF